MKIIYSSKFEREYRKLAPALKRDAKKREKIFRANPSDHRLKTHKLKGHLRQYSSFSITPKHRIIFRYGKGDVIYFLSIGDHRIYK